MSNIKELDHVATRVKAEERDAAIIEFMTLTNYDFDFAICVDILNSITNVARLKDEGFAMVFTSGISPAAGENMPVRPRSSSGDTAREHTTWPSGPSALRTPLPR